MPVDTIKSTIGYGANPQGRPNTDFYRTPRIAVEKLLSVESFEGPILEPACGDGAISEVLIEKGYQVASYDLYDYGYGKTGPEYDWTKVKPNQYRFNTIITNPPFNLAQEFIETSLMVTKKNEGKVALILRLSFLEGQKRQKLFMGTPLKKVYVFSKRLTFIRPGDEGKSYSGMMAYMWAVWDWKHLGSPEIGWI